MAIGDIMNTSSLTSTFDDEFSTFTSSPNGSTGLWRTTLKGGDRTLGSNGEQEYYSDSSVGVNPFSDTAGVLDIQATPGSNALGLPYNSGVITTENSFNQLYGYFEIDAKLPTGQGLWPAFWLLPASGAWPPELDAFEVLGNSATTLYFSTHSAVQATQGTALTVSNVSTGFNLYGVMWGPKTVDLYINNVEVASMPTPPDMDVPMYMLANLAVGGYWPGNPNSSTVFPANMLIDYVRAYAYPGTAGGTVYDTNAAQNIGPAALAPVVSAPASLAATRGAATPVGKFTVTANWPGGFFTVLLSDTTGLLATSTTADVFTTGEGTSSLTLTGNLGPINTALASLTYQGSAAGSEYIWASATDPQGLQETVHIVATDSAPVVATPPVVTLPAASTVAAGASVALSGVSVADSAGGSFSVTVSDGAGLLNTAAASALTISGEGSTSLKLTGSLAAINADLASLTYRAGTATGADWLWVSANGSTGGQGLGHEVVTVTAAVAAPPVVTAPATLAVTAGHMAALAGVKVADGASAGNFSVTVSDSFGLLSTAAAASLTLKGENSTSLTLTGGLAAINADLASLTYNAGKTAGTDWLWVSADDPSGAQGLAHVVVSVAAAPAVLRGALALESPSAPCFCAGTRIATALGEETVEALRVGDLVRTLNGAAQRIQWIGTRSYEGRFIAGNRLMLPVCIKAGAIASGVPARDLLVSPGHAIHVDGMLVPAWRLLNGVTIRQAKTVERVTYFHIELARHDVIFAEGCPVESFLDEGHRAQFQNGYEAMEAAAGPGLKRTETGFALEALRRRLAGNGGVKAGGGALVGYVDQAGPLAVSGWGRRQNGGERPVSLDVRVDGRRVARVLANLYRADLRAAGMGDGCHGFEVALPAWVRGRITVHDSAGGEMLDYTREARARAA